MNAPAIALAERGVYDGVPNDVYHADPVPEGSLSSTGARLLLKPSCPALFKYWQDNGGSPRKRVFDMGQAVHTLVLGDGPELVRIEADSYQTKAAREDRDAAYAAGQTPVLAEEHDTALAMAQVLRNHDTAGYLFAPDSGKPEQTLIWRDPVTLVMCRARLDWLRHPGSSRLIIPDLKSSWTAEPGSLRRSMVNYGYHMQGAFYSMGAAELGLSEVPPAFLLVFQEKTPPYLVTIAQPDNEAIEAGTRRARKAMDLYRKCRLADHWPAYTDGSVIPLSMPRWAQMQHEDEIEAGDYDIEDDYS